MTCFGELFFHSHRSADKVKSALGEPIPGPCRASGTQCRYVRAFYHDSFSICNFLFRQKPHHQKNLETIYLFPDTTQSTVLMMGSLPPMSSPILLTENSQKSYIKTYFGNTKKSAHALWVLSRRSIRSRSRRWRLEFPSKISGSGTLRPHMLEKNENVQRVN